MTESYTMKLTRPIEAHGEELTELQIRDPDAAALKGVMAAIGPDGLKFDVGDVLKIIAAGAGIPPSSAEKMSMKDVLTNTKGILGFFGASTS